MRPGEPQHTYLWVIEFIMDPASEAKDFNLLFAPMPWTDCAHIEAALMVFESRELAEAGLEHYLARTAPEAEDCASYHLLSLAAWELLDMLEATPREYGLTHVTINPIISRYFENVEGCSALYDVGAFMDDLRYSFDLQ